MTKLDFTFLKKIMPRFNDILKTNQGQTWTLEREKKDLFFKKNFAEESINKIDEGVLREFIHILWAFSGWTNKDYLLEQMLQSGLSKIKEAFQDLLYSDKSLASRFNKMRKIRIMGAASISEILVHSDHTKYPIWNRRTKAGLMRLGVAPTSLPKWSQISGSQYEEYSNLVHSVFEQINRDYPEITDLLKLDFLLYYISTVPEIKPSKPKGKFDHNTAIEQILQLGDGLGFEVRKEFPVTRGCRIDALWKSRIANLGTISYAFEVHRSGSRDSAILNLQRCKADPTIQKVIIVSTSEELETFKREISSLQEDFRKSVGYFDVEDLQKALDHQESIKEILMNIGLLRSGIL